MPRWCLQPPLGASVFYPAAPGQFSCSTWSGMITPAVGGSGQFTWQKWGAHGLSSQISKSTGHADAEAVAAVSEAKTIYLLPFILLFVGTCRSKVPCHQASLCGCSVRSMRYSETCLALSESFHVEAQVFYEVLESCRFSFTRTHENPKFLLCSFYCLDSTEIRCLWYPVLF